MKRFFAAYYDEWVLAFHHGQDGPIISAAVYRSLRGAVGELVFDDFVVEMIAIGKVKPLVDFSKAHWDTPVLQLLDYM